MRKNKVTDRKKEFSILTLDDDRLMTETLQSYFQAAGYEVDIENDPIKAIERVRTKSYDILLLDFLMRPICGDEVVRRIRAFNEDLFIILLTGHKSMAPPIKTIHELDIQGYYEKSERFDQLELLVESCTKSIRQMRTIRSYRDGLRRILDQVPELNGQLDIDKVLAKILEQISEFLPNKDSFVYFDLSVMQNTEVVPAVTGPTHLFFGNGVFEAKKETAKQYFDRCLSEKPQVITDTQNPMLIAPVFVSSTQRYGMLAVQYPNAVPNADLQLMEVYAKQVGSIVSNHLLHAMLKMQNAQLRDAYATLRQNYMETIDAMRQMVDAKDFYTRGHSDRVSYYTVRIAQAMHKSEVETERLRIAGLFHDIGKIGTSDIILHKNGKLTPEEYDSIKEHPSLGKKILLSFSAFHDILPFIEAHHERFDGGGYPHHLAGEDIPEGARIISVADAFDAMTSKRIYRDSLSLRQAADELVKGKNTQFDAHIVDVFLKILEDPDALEKSLAGALHEDAAVFKRD